MALLGELTIPLPKTAPPALRSKGWMDKQCATQLAAWAEMRMTARLHGNTDTRLCRSVELARPPHRVSPYPAFYDRLGRLSLSLAKMLGATASSLPLDDAEAANALATAMKTTWRRFSWSAVKRLQRKLGSGWQPDWSARQRQQFLTPLVLRAARAQALSAQDMVILRLLVIPDEEGVSEKLTQLATLCRSLARIARSQLAGEALSKSDSTLLDGIGGRLGALEECEGNSWEQPKDDLPDLLVVATTLTSPPSHFHIAVARPRRLLVVWPHEGKNILYQGAVGSYREFARQDAMSVAAWRKVSEEHAPLFRVGGNDK